MFNLTIDNMKYITIVCGIVGILIIVYLLYVYFIRIRGYFQLRRLKKNIKEAKKAGSQPTESTSLSFLSLISSSRKIGFIRTLVLGLTGIAFILIMLSSLSILVAFEGYKSFVFQELVAEIQCIPTDQKQEMKLFFTPIYKGEPGVKREFTIYGDEWRISGMVVLFVPKLNQLGVHSLYCLTHIDGFYHKDIFDHTEKLRVSHPLISTEEHSIWKDKEKKQLSFPYKHFIESVYREFLSAPPARDRVYLVYTTDRGGLKLEPKDREEYIKNRRDYYKFYDEKQ